MKAGDNMSNAEFLDFLKPVYHNISYCLKPGGVCYIWMADCGPDAEFELALRSVKDLHEQMHLVWIKNTATFSMGRLDYDRRHEICKYGWKTGAAHYFCPDKTLTTLIQDDTPNFDKMKKEDAIKLLKTIYDNDI